MLTLSQLDSNIEKAFPLLFVSRLLMTIGASPFTFIEPSVVKVRFD